MKYFTLLLFFLMSSQMLFAQTRRMNNAETGRNYSTEQQTLTVQPLLQEAERLFRAGKYEDTFFTLENAVALNPNSPEAYLLRAKFKKLVGMETEAQADLRLANRINPLAANLYGYNGNGGLLKLISVKPESAVQDLTTFQKLNYYYQAIDRKISVEGSEEAMLKKLGLVVEDIEANYLQNSLDTLNKILEKHPNAAIAHDLKGVVLKKQGKFDGAVNAFTKAAELEPGFAIAWYNLGQIERSLNHYDQAKIYLDKAINLQSDLMKAYFERAMLHKQMGNKELALNDYNTVIKMRGNTYMEAFLNRGLTKKMLGDYGGAFGDLNWVIEEFPDNAELRKNRGNLHLLFGLHRKAIDDYTDAIQLDENYSEAYYNRGLTFFLLYDKVSGCADLDKSIDLGYEMAMEAKTYFCTE